MLSLRVISECAISESENSVFPKEKEKRERQSDCSKHNSYSKLFKENFEQLNDFKFGKTQRKTWDTCSFCNFV